MTDPSPVVGGHGPHDDQPRRYAEAQRIYNTVKRPGRRVLTLPEIQRVIDAHESVRDAAEVPALRERLSEAADAYRLGDWDTLERVLGMTELPTGPSVAVSDLLTGETDA